MEINPLQTHVNPADIAPERLAGNPALTEQQKIGEASRQFEAILLKQILDASQKTVIQSSYSDNSTASSIYHDMVTSHLADSISKSGSFGLAKTFEQQLTRQDAAIQKDHPSVKLHPLNSSHVHARKAPGPTENIDPPSHGPNAVGHQTNGKTAPGAKLNDGHSTHGIFHGSRVQRLNRMNFRIGPPPHHSAVPAANTTGHSNHE